MHEARNYQQEPIGACLMGDELHITRADTWMDSEENPITLEEWLQYMERNPQMCLDGYADVLAHGELVLRFESEGLSVLTGWSRDGIDGGMAW